MPPVPEKHLPYFEVLDALRTAHDCVICWQVKKATKARIEGLLYESVTDGETSEHLRQSHGYCPHHAELLIATGDALGVGLLHRPVLMSWVAHLESLPAELPYRFLGQGRDTDWIARFPCPLCKEEQALASRTVATITEWIAEEIITEAISSSPPFCPSHFQAVLAQCGPPDQRAMLLENERRKIHSLLQELEALIDSFHPEHSKTVMEREKDSWIRAAHLIARARRPPPMTKRMNS